MYSIYVKIPIKILTAESLLDIQRCCMKVKIGFLLFFLLCKKMIFFCCIVPELAVFLVPAAILCWPDDIYFSFWMTW